MDSQEIIGLLKEINRKLDELRVFNKCNITLYEQCKLCGEWYTGYHFCTMTTGGMAGIGVQVK
jgi:hypothetical protein